MTCYVSYEKPHDMLFMYRVDVCSLLNLTSFVVRFAFILLTDLKAKGCVTAEASHLAMTVCFKNKDHAMANRVRRSIHTSPALPCPDRLSLIPAACHE
jgi:hypothetical protein